MQLSVESCGLLPLLHSAETQCAFQSHCRPAVTMGGSTLSWGTHWHTSGARGSHGECGGRCRSGGQGRRHGRDDPPVWRWAAGQDAHRTCLISRSSTELILLILRHLSLPLCCDLISSQRSLNLRYFNPTEQQSKLHFSDLTFAKRNKIVWLLNKLLLSDPHVKVFPLKMCHSRAIWHVSRISPPQKENAVLFVLEDYPSPNLAEPIFKTGEKLQVLSE